MAHIKIEILWDFITEDLTVANHAMVDNHLKECSGCRQIYLSELAFHKNLSELEYEKPSVVFSKNILIKIEQEIKLDKSSKFWIKFTETAIIGAMIVAIMSAFLLLDFQKINLVIDENNFRNTGYILLGTCLLWAFYGLDHLLRNSTNIKKITGGT